MAKAINISSSSSPVFSVSRITQRLVLNYASLQENSNKFYILELQEGNGVYPYRIYTEYGRMGKTPRKEGRYFHSLWEAEKEFRTIVSSKQRDGYKQIEVDGGNSASTTVQLKTQTRKAALSSINDKVLQLIGKLYQDATTYLVSSIDTPLGKLSASQVARGLEILHQIEEILNNGKSDRLDYYSNQFYSIIPVSFGHRVDYRKFLIDDYYKLNEKKDLLGVMSSVVQVQDNLEKTLEEKYKGLNIQLNALSSRSSEYKRISDWVKNSQGSNHHFRIKIQDVFEVEKMTGMDKFNPYNVETKELFHGTRNENILNIMQNGLKIKPKSAVHTGSMFGAGIYFADQSTKSANYCWGFSGGIRHDSYYLFICDVATGKMKEFTTSQPHLTAAPRPYNSVMGKKGSSLVHNEYIVYRDSQVKLKYIVEFQKA